MNPRHIVPVFLLVAAAPVACSKDPPPATPEGESSTPPASEPTEPSSPGGPMDAGVEDPSMGQPGTEPGTNLQKQGPIAQKNTGGTTGGPNPNGGASMGGTTGGSRATGGTNSTGGTRATGGTSSTGGTRATGGTNSTGGTRTGGGGATGM